MELTEGQKRAIEIAKKRYFDGEPYTIIAGFSGTGKALPNDMKIPTPEGWREVREIKKGDFLFNKEGNSTKVLEVFPQGEKEVYKITFKDGREIECSGDHLWTYYFNSHGNQKPRTETTKEILDRCEKMGGYQDSVRKYRFNIPLNSPVNYPSQKLPIDPYVLGLFLGDGSLRGNILYFSSNDEEILVEIVERMKWKNYKRNSELNYTWTFDLSTPQGKKTKVYVKDFLQDLPELINLKSEDKFIPEKYMYSDVSQRFELLAGLLDTDGSVDYKGRIRYTSVSKKMIQQVVELCHSLGFITTVREDIREGKYTTGICYDILIQCKPEEKLKLFKLSRKKEKIEKWLNNGKKKEHKKYLPITKIEKLDYKKEMTCFLVDNEEHLFLCKDFIVTHNTTVVNNLIEELGLTKESVSFISYTGKATLVLQEKGCPNAQTAHKLLYRTKKDGIRYIHTPRKYLENDYKLIIVDEVSMLPKNMWDLLLTHKVHVIALGDPGQLSPINKEQCHNLLDNPHIFLKEIMRQEMDNEIIEYSMKIRNGEKLPLLDGKNLKIINGKDLSVSMLKWADQILCATNKMRKDINNIMRLSYDFPVDEAVVGDKIICLKNYWDIYDWKEEEPLINGTIGYLTRRIEMFSKVLWNRHIYLSNIETTTGKEFVDLHISKEILEGLELPYEPKKLSKKERDLMDLEFDYGYCISTWKAQGSEYNKIVGIEEKFPYDKEEHQRFLYTMLTRAKDKAVIVRA